MSNSRHALWFIVFYGLTIPQGLAAAVPSTDTLLPQTTVGFVSATKWPRLIELWNKTQVGKLMADPVMKPFKDDVRAQLQAQLSALSDRLGIQPEDLREMATGEACLALIQPQPNLAATCLLLNVSDNLNKAKALLAKARAGLSSGGAQENVVTIRGIPVYVFDVPLPQAQQTAAQLGGTTPAAAPPAAAATTQTVYFLTDSLFAACDNLAVAQEILGRLANGTRAGSLSQVVAYRMVMKRCAADTPGHAVDVRWFVYPLGYAEATRAATIRDRPRQEGKTIVEIMNKQGYAAFQGVGGHVEVLADNYQVLHRTAIFAPPPYKESMKMFVFPNGKEFTPQAWVGRDVSTYSTLYINIQNAFENFGSLYDQILGEKGLWQQTLEGEINDPTGPHIDIGKELIANLGQRVTMVTDCHLPITTSSERLLFAIESKDDAAVAKAIEKCVKNDSAIQKRAVAGRVVWEIVEETESNVPQLKVEVPSLTPKKEEKSKPGEKGDKGEKEDDQDKESHFLPHGAITVAYGQLFIASHIDFLAKILKPLGEQDRLAAQPEFQEVWDLTCGKLGVTPQSLRSFSWTDRALRPTYELIRQGKMPQSESLLGRTLNSLASPTKKGVLRRQRIDGSKLPDFDFVRKALGPSTGAMVSEENGWFIKGALLTR